MAANQPPPRPNCDDGAGQAGQASLHAPGFAASREHVRRRLALSRSGECTKGLRHPSEGPAPFAARLTRERNRWGAIVKATGFTAVE